MNTYKRMMAIIAVFAATVIGAVASPLYYTILHAIEDDTMDIFRDGGSGSLMLSMDEGESYHTVSTFRFDRYGRAFARVYALNHAPGDAWVKLSASFNESDRGQPADTVMEGTVDEFFESVSPYSRLRWLSYLPVYVSLRDPTQHC